MSLTVWKIVLHAADEQKIMVPEGAEILCAREQFDQICIWYRCEPQNPKEIRRIVIRGTGHPDVPDQSRYLGTASLSGGHLMFHVFERR